MKQIRRKRQAQQGGFFDTKDAYTVLEKGSVPKGVMSTTAHVEPPVPRIWKVTKHAYTKDAVHSL